MEEILYNDIVFPFGIDPTTGDYGYIKAGADTVTPFKSGGDAYRIAHYDSISIPQARKTTADATYTVTITLPADMGDITTADIYITMDKNQIYVTDRQGGNPWAVFSVSKSISNNVLTLVFRCNVPGGTFTKYGNAYEVDVYLIKGISDYPAS